MKRVSRALAAATVVATGAVAGALAGPTAANAGIYTWQYVNTYTTNAQCQAAGPAAQSSLDGDTFRCTVAADGVRLYVGFTW
jgi:hypothetical protein